MLNIPTELIDNPGIAPEASLDLSTQLGIFLIYKPHITVHSNFYSSGHAPYCHVGFYYSFSANFTPTDLRRLILAHAPYPILNALILIFLSYPLFTKQGFHDTAVTGTQDRESVPPRA